MLSKKFSFLFFTLSFLPFTINKEMVIKTRVVRINPEKVEPDKIGMIARILQKNGIIAYPTDTFYGLGANCFSVQAIQRIYQLKKRKTSKPLPVLVADMDMVKKIAIDIPHLFWRLAEKFWPGPLTLVVKASAELPRQLLGPKESIGIRQPSIQWLKELMKKTAFPLTATSANISEEKEISDPGEVIDFFYGKIDLVVDGGQTRAILPSTVVDLTLPRPEILREGALPLSHIAKYLKREA